MRKAPSRNPARPKRHQTKRVARSLRLPLVAQKKLVVLRGQGRRDLHVVDATGKALLSLTVTSDGIAVQLGAMAVRVGPEGALTIEAEHVTFVGRKGVSLRSNGDIDVSASGKIALDAREQKLSARLGNVDISANDDVAINGERVLLNS